MVKSLTLEDVKENFEGNKHISTTLIYRKHDGTTLELKDKTGYTMKKNNR